MLVIDKRCSQKIPFKEIEEGECFIDEDGELNIKFDMSPLCATGEGYPNAVDLENGFPWYVSDEYKVIKVKAKVVIEN